jgi:hypothetical protein
MDNLEIFSSICDMNRYKRALQLHDVHIYVNLAYLSLRP